MMKFCIAVGFVAALAAVESAHMQPAGSSRTQKRIVQVGPPPSAPFSPAVVAGDFIYVAGTLAQDQSGKVSGDIRAQTKRTLDSIAATLKAAGASLDRAASVQVYLRNPSDFAAMNEVYRTYWTSDPPARTTIGADLVFPDALVEISMIAIRPGAERRVIHPSDWSKSPNPYSYGILSGDTLFLAGLVSRNGRDNSVVTGDMTVQTKAVMDNGGAILAAAGLSYADVVSSRVYITDRAQFQTMNAAYRGYFPKQPPARATVVAPLMGPQFVVEVTMTAVKSADRQAITTPNADGTPGSANPNLSAAIRVGNRLYLSGMLDGSQKGDVAAQTRATMARLGRTLTAAGFAWTDVVDGIVYLTDMKRFADMNTGYRETIAKDFPARATVGVGLVADDPIVEIMLTAVK